MAIVRGGVVNQYINLPCILPCVLPCILPCVLPCVLGNRIYKPVQCPNVRYIHKSKIDIIMGCNQRFRGLYINITKIYFCPLQCKILYHHRPNTRPTACYNNSFILQTLIYIGLFAWTCPINLCSILPATVVRNENILPA